MLLRQQGFGRDHAPRAVGSPASCQPGRGAKEAAAGKLRQPFERAGSEGSGLQAQQQDRHAAAGLEGPHHAALERPDHERDQFVCGSTPPSGRPRDAPADAGAARPEARTQLPAAPRRRELPHGVGLVCRLREGLPRAGHGPGRLRELLCGLQHAHADLAAQDPAERHRGPAVVHQFPAVLLGVQPGLQGRLRDPHVEVVARRWSAARQLHALQHSGLLQAGV
mmetsp:Transcript_48214/g.125035  ORF Transcript_48214/g.125035 Transcript_48214/m.125035 type:complete len:223 (-) Transcript_48214:332-1000(-)